MAGSLLKTSTPHLIPMCILSGVELAAGGIYRGRKTKNVSVCGMENIMKKVKKAVGNSVPKRFRRNRTRFKLMIRSLSDSYQNPYEVMLHSVFQILVDFVEKEKPWKYINWNSDEGHKKASTVFKRAYRYWKMQRPKLMKDLDKLVHISVKDFNLGDISKPFKSDPKKVKLLRQSYKDEQHIDDLDKKHLIDLMTVRKYMWT